MGRTVTAEEAKRRTGYDLVQEAGQTHQPLIVILEDGTMMAIQQYQPPELTEKTPVLQPLLKLPGSVPAGWKDDFYEQNEAGSTNASLAEEQKARK